MHAQVDVYKQKNLFPSVLNQAKLNTSEFGICHLSTQWVQSLEAVSKLAEKCNTTKKVPQNNVDAKDVHVLVQL